MRDALSIMLVVMSLSPAALAQPPVARSLKEQVLNISPGSPVEVRLTDKSKLRGRLGPVTDNAFELETVKGGKIETAHIAFDQLRSIKDTTKTSFGHSVGRGFLIAGIVIGTIIAASAIAVAVSN